jgi:hypothetical protein
MIEPILDGGGSNQDDKLAYARSRRRTQNRAAYVCHDRSPTFHDQDS